MTTGTTQSAIQPLCDSPVSPVEVVATHVTRRRHCEGFWPRMRLQDLPESRRVSVRTPSGVWMKVKVRIWVSGEFVVASARPCDQCNGEDLNASGEFPLASELEAERICLESL